jgi:transcriptional regulator with XRE-family HTH domain
MKLGEKIRYLREVEGSLRGLDRAMTQQELVRAIREEMGSPMSQSYMSQIESGARPHLTNTTRLLLARFFKVHPGYLVDDPEGYHAELLSEARMLHTRTDEDKLDLWLVSGAEKFRRDPELRRALLTAAQHDDTRRCLLLLAAILETPSLADRLLEVLRPELAPRKKSLALVNGTTSAHPLAQTAPNEGANKAGASRANWERKASRTANANGRRPASKKERR